MTWVVSIITALIMLAIGVFWMFVLLVATNGYSEATGTVILASNLVLIVLSTIVATFASGWLSKRLVAKTGKSPLIVAPLYTLGVVTVTVTILFISSMIIIFIAEATR